MSSLPKLALDRPPFLLTVCKFSTKCWFILRFSENFIWCFLMAWGSKKMISIILHIFPARLKEIADGLGDDLWNMLAPITRREEIQQVRSGKKYLEILQVQFVPFCFFLPCFCRSGIWEQWSGFGDSDGRRGDGRTDGGAGWSHNYRGFILFTFWGLVDIWSKVNGESWVLSI